MSDEWFIAVCWSSLLFGIFIIKKCVEVSLTSFGTLKYDCVIKERKVLICPSPINSSLTIGLSFLFLIISAIISSKNMDNLRFFLDCILQYFYKHLAYHLSIQ